LPLRVMRLARSLAGYADVLDEGNWITPSSLAAGVRLLTGARVGRATTAVLAPFTHPSCPRILMAASGAARVLSLSIWVWPHRALRRYAPSSPLEDSVGRNVSVVQRRIVHFSTVGLPS